MLTNLVHFEKLFIWTDFTFIWLFTASLTSMINQLVQYQNSPEFAHVLHLRQFSVNAKLLICWSNVCLNIFCNDYAHWNSWIPLSKKRSIYEFEENIPWWLVQMISESIPEIHWLMSDRLSVLSQLHLKDFKIHASALVLKFILCADYSGLQLYVKLKEQSQTKLVQFIWLSIHLYFRECILFSTPC